jgi:hypothetical protein
LVELKEKELEPCLNSYSEHNEGKWIIDSEPTTTITTTTIQPEEPEDPKEGEHLFNSQMWVKGTPLYFIVVNESQKNLISVEVVKGLKLSMMPQPQPYTIGWLIQGQDLRVNQQCHLSYMESSPSKMRYCVMFPCLKFVMFF